MADRVQGPGQRLPLSTERVSRISLVASVPLLAVGVTSAAIDQDSVLGIGIGLGLVALAFGILLPLGSRGQRAVVDEMAAGQRFVHWTYPIEDWTRHVDLEREARSVIAAFGLLPAAVGALAVSCVIVAVHLFGKTMTGQQLAAGIALAFAIAIGSYCLIGGYHNINAFVRARLLLDAGGHVLIGPQGLYYSGEFWAGRSDNPLFRGVQPDEGSSRGLVFEFITLSRRGGSFDHRICVPIPPGREAEARQVTEQVRAAWRVSVG